MTQLQVTSYEMQRIQLGAQRFVLSSQPIDPGPLTLVNPMGPEIILARAHDSQLVHGVHVVSLDAWIDPKDGSPRGRRA